MTTAPPLPPRTTCGMPCPEHEHACPRSRGHGGPCRPVKEKGAPGHRCDWMDGRVIR